MLCVSGAAVGTSMAPSDARRCWRAARLRGLLAPHQHTATRVMAVHCGSKRASKRTPAGGGPRTLLMHASGSVLLLVLADGPDPSEMEAPAAFTRVPHASIESYTDLSPPSPSLGFSPPPSPPAGAASGSAWGAGTVGGADDGGGDVPSLAAAEEEEYVYYEDDEGNAGYTDAAGNYYPLDDLHGYYTATGDYVLYDIPGSSRRPHSTHKRLAPGSSRFGNFRARAAESEGRVMAKKSFSLAKVPVGAKLSAHKRLTPGSSRFGNFRARAAESEGRVMAKKSSSPVGVRSPRSSAKPGNPGSVHVRLTAGSGRFGNFRARAQGSAEKVKVRRRLEIAEGDAEASEEAPQEEAEGASAAAADSATAPHEAVPVPAPAPDGGAAPTSPLEIAEGDAEASEEAPQEEAEGASAAAADSTTAPHEAVPVPAPAPDGGAAPTSPKSRFAAFRSRAACSEERTTARRQRDGSSSGQSSSISHEVSSRACA